MRILYIFPHPDDESFGPAAAIHAQKTEGHEVFLLTLTKGGATKQRKKLGLSIREMGEIRHKEMLAVEKTLKLDGMTVLNLEDGGLQEKDPRKLENIIEAHILQIKPEILVTYPVHGISGFHDHIVTHAVVKRVYLEMRDKGADYLKRLAFFTIPDNGNDVWQAEGIRMKQSPTELIDCEMKLSEDNISAMKAGLACYETYKDTIEKSGVVEKIGKTLYFEFYAESFQPKVSCVTSGLL